MFLLICPSTQPLLFFLQVDRFLREGRVDFPSNSCHSFIHKRFCFRFHSEAPSHLSQFIFYKFFFADAFLNMFSCSCSLVHPLLQITSSGGFSLSQPTASATSAASMSVPASHLFRAIHVKQLVYSFLIY